MAVCTRPSVTITNTEYISSINAFKFNLRLVDSSQGRTFLLLYRKQASNSTQFINGLASIVSTYSIDVIFGDFNINFLNCRQVQTLRSLMESFGYSQIVTKPTFIASGSLLDHVYVRSTVIERSCE